MLRSIFTVIFLISTVVSTTLKASSVTDSSYDEHRTEAITEKPILDNLILEKAVIMMRHGVRSPLKMTPEMIAITPDKWPDWPVPNGYVTKKGVHLITQLSQAYYQRLQIQQLMPKRGCPANKEVFVWANNTERTIVTGKAFLFGLPAGCHGTFYHAPITQNEPLFNPIKAAVCKLDTDKAIESVTQAANMPIDAFDQHYQHHFEPTSEVLQFSKSSACLHSDSPNHCEIANLIPTHIEFDNYHMLKIKGALGELSSISELFLLQNAEGMQAAWGRIHSMQQWHQLLWFHTMKANLSERPFYIASHLAAPLLDTIAHLLNDQPLPHSPIKEPKQYKLAVLVGHDTNIASIAGALNLSWQLIDQPDLTPPGGGLVFERWRKPDGSKMVKLKILYQTMPDMRAGLGHNILMESIDIPNCTESCTPEFFAQLVQSVIVPACLPEDYFTSVTHKD